MRSTLKRKRTKQNKLIYFFLIILLIVAALGLFFFTQSSNKNNDENANNKATQMENEQTTNEEQEVEEPEGMIEEDVITTVRIAAAGDIMVHETQYKSAYDSVTDSYDFTSMFADVKPYFSKADFTIANFETTLAGDARPFSGYPQFNSPDEIADAIIHAEIDALTTANNHSLDTGSEGLKRTVQTLQEKGLKTVGTYDQEVDSRVLVHEVNDITFSIIAYTESTNGLGAQYNPDELNTMINLMEKEHILRDIEDAKNQNVDFIIAFMHWGEEYMTEPNDKQIDFANFMAEAGVDLILGSHPHVIQKSDMIQTKNNHTFVIYSMGNFISNQRQETLGDGYELTEDGIIVYFDIEKNMTTNTTELKEVEYVPTWVYRNLDQRTDKQVYRILPIEQFLDDDHFDDSFKARMERSYEATMSKMLVQ